MDTGILIAIIGILAAPMAAVITWLLNRKKHISEIYNALSESSQAAVETMQMTMQELRIQLVEAKEKIEELISENEALRDDLRELKTQNDLLMKENSELKDKIDELYQHIKGMN